MDTLLKLASRLFLCLALAGTAAAQEGSSVDWLAWKGAPAPWKNDIEASRVVSEYRGWLADLRVKVLTGRLAELPGWGERLETIRLHATSARGLPAQGELLVEVAQARARALESQGRLAEARAALDALLFAPGERPYGNAELVSAPPSLLSVAEAALASPALAQDRVDFGASAGREAQDASLEDSLRKALAQGDLEFVEQIGARAIPALEEALASDLERVPGELERDPFVLLMRLSERRAAAFALAHVDRAGYVFRLRVLRAMQHAEVFGGNENHEAWGGRPGEGEPRTALVPEWPLVLAKLVRDRDIAGEGLPLVEIMLEADGMTREVTTALLDTLADSGQDLASALLQQLVSTKVKRSSQALYEGLVTHDDPALRRMAAGNLYALGARSPLFLRADDPDKAVRLTAARALSAMESNEPPPLLDDLGQKALKRLLADPSVEVRRAACAALIGAPQALEPELYRAAARDPDPAVRANVAWLRHPDAELVRETLLALARETDPQVRKGVDERLADRETWQRPETALAAAELRLADTLWPTEARRMLIHQLARFDQGVQTLFACAVASPEDSLLRSLVQQENSLLASTGSAMGALLTLDDATLAAAYIGVNKVSSSSFEQLSGYHLVRAKPPRWEAMLRVLEDEQAPLQARLTAAALAARGGGERFRRALIALLVSEPLRSRELSASEVEQVSNAVAALPARDGNDLALAALRAEGLRDDVCARLVGGYDAQGPSAREITLAVLDRWLDLAEEDYAAGAVSVALRHLLTLPEDRELAMLEQAARNPHYLYATAQTISALQDPVYLPLLEAAIRDERPVISAREAAVRALGSIPGDDATDALIRVMATTTSENVRGACRQALDNRRKIEEERLFWADSKEARLDRSGAVQRLLDQLRDADSAIRAEAARALGTLGALETLPTLIDMLKDRDEGVRKAVRAALERLNSLEQKEAVPVQQERKAPEDG